MPESNTPSITKGFCPGVGEAVGLAVGVPPAVGDGVGEFALVGEGVGVAVGVAPFVMVLKCQSAPPLLSQIPVPPVAVVVKTQSIAVASASTVKVCVHSPLP